MKPGDSAFWTWNREGFAGIAPETQAVMLLTDYGNGHWLVLCEGGKEVVVQEESLEAW